MNTEYTSADGSSGDTLPLFGRWQGDERVWNISEQVWQGERGSKNGCIFGDTITHIR